MAFTTHLGNYVYFKDFPNEPFVNLQGGYYRNRNGEVFCHQPFQNILVKVEINQDKVKKEEKEKEDIKKEIENKERNRKSKNFRTVYWTRHFKEVNGGEVK